MQPTSRRDIRAILFDKDGTLIHFEQTWFGILWSLAKRLADGDEGKARSLLEKGGYDWITGRFRANSVIAAGTIEDIVDLWHPNVTYEERTALIQSYDGYGIQESTRTAVVIDGVENALKTLHQRGFVLGIATNDSETGARATAKTLGLSALFHTFIGYDTVLRPKPHPDPVHYFAQTTGFKVEQIAMVGDNPHDMQTAHTAGAGYAIGVLSGNSSHAELESLADAILPSIAELPAFLVSHDIHPSIEKMQP